MDNVLYEIRDEKGISKKIKYDAWKEEVLRNLLQAGFIKIFKDLYIISEEGRAVIEQESFMYYYKTAKLKESISVDANKKETSIRSNNFWMLLVSGSLLGITLIWLLINSGIVF